jgi:hypothetical protein
MFDFDTLTLFRYSVVFLVYFLFRIFPLSHWIGFYKSGFVFVGIQGDGKKGWLAGALKIPHDRSPKIVRRFPLSLRKGKGVGRREEGGALALYRHSTPPQRNLLLNNLRQYFSLST